MFVQANSESDIRSAPDATTALVARNATERWRQCLRRLQNLERASFAGCVELTDSILDALAECDSLKWLDVSGCELITDRGASTAARLQSLEYLDFCLCHRITDQTLCALSRHRTLRRLGLMGCFEITDAGVGAISEIPNLGFLDLSSCERLTNASMVSLAQRERQLKSLTLPSFAEINDQGLRCIGEMSQLQHLHLGELDQVSDQGLSEIGHMDALSSLRLGRFSSATASGVAAAVAGPNLRWLCLSLDDGEMGRVFDALGGSMLEYLQIACASRPSWDDLLRISRCPTLRMVEFVRRSWVTKDTLNEIHRVFPAVTRVLSA